VLLVSTYELGHQPLQVASPAAALAAAGHQVRACDLAVETLDDALVDWAQAAAFSVPMHTATRLAVEAVRRVRERRPDLPSCAYGLYAGAGGGSWGEWFDRTIAGEYEPALVQWVESLVSSGGGGLRPRHAVALGRTRFARPERRLLPGLDRYARLLRGDEEIVAGYVEASHGCVHRCRHCPVPVVYDGRIRTVAKESVLADVDQLVEMGARHITFGDPDFLNGPHHSLRVIGEVHRRHPGLTFDCTTKVEHILRHRHIWPELAGAGLLFVVSAFESTSDEVLARLDKGHTVADEVEAVSVLRSAGVEVRPSLLPFTPWTRVTDMVELFDFVVANDLIGAVDPVQYSIRLLVPEGSLLLGDPDLAPRLGPYDGAALAYPWSAAEPLLDRLQQDMAAVAEREAEPGAAFAELHALVSTAAAEAGVGRPRPLPSPLPVRPVPRLSEAWFCCAEPTAAQLTPVGGSA